MQTANALKSSATGVEFLSFFGALWFLFALAAWDALNALRTALLLVAVLVFFALSEWVKRAARQFPQVPVDPARARRFYWINALQWGAIFVLCQILHWTGRDRYAVTGVAIVVALHFFALARPLGNPASRGTGAMLLLWAVATLAFVPAERLQSITAIGAGLILWQAAASALATALANAWQPRIQPVCSKTL